MANKLKKMEIYLNILHYCLYKAFYYLHLLFYKVNPGRLIGKIPLIKKRHKELGVNIDQEINNLYSDPDNGIGVMGAGGALISILFFLFMAIYIGLLSIFNIDRVLMKFDFLICVLASFVISYIFVFKKDKYVKYFNIFKDWTKYEAKKFGWFSFLFVIIVISSLLITISFT